MSNEWTIRSETIITSYTTADIQIPTEGQAEGKDETKSSQQTAHRLFSDPKKKPEWNKHLPYSFDTLLIPKSDILVQVTLGVTFSPLLLLGFVMKEDGKGW